jgi:soluble lytic murein transglycosylase
MDLSGLGGLPNDPRFQQGQEFWRLGLYQQAQNEFEDLRQSLQSDPVSTYQLARYLNQIGLYRSAILAARQVLSLAGMDDAGSMNAPALFNHIRFGTYFPDLVIPESQAYDFHPLFVWSIIRQESLFESFIRSSADARGLMQIIPSTGQTIAEQTVWPPNFTADDLYRPLVSIKLGLAYLDEQMKYLNGNLYAALAAYNAGPGNASAWKDLSGDDPDLFLEIIRLDEPRRYIQGIYEIFNIYRRLYDRSP